MPTSGRPRGVDPRSYHGQATQSPAGPNYAEDPNPTATAWANAGQAPPGYGRPGEPGTAPGTNQLLPSVDPRYTGAQGPGGPQGYGPLNLGEVGLEGGHGRGGPAQLARSQQAAQTPQNPALINPDNQYVDAFNASMATQRQAIDNALAASLVQLGARRDAAGKVVAGIPQQIKDTYAQTDTKMSGIMKAADPNGEGVGGDANAALYANDNTAARNAGQSVQPLLQLGVQANYDRGEAGLNQAHLEGLSQLANQEAQFKASLAAGEQAHNYQVQDKAYDAAHPLAGLTAAQRADINYRNRSFDTSQAQSQADTEYKQNADAQGEGYTSYADKQEAEAQAASYSHDKPPSDNDLKGMDINLVYALYHRGIINKKNLDKYTGNSSK